MAGYNIIVISGIDGKFTEFNNLIEPQLSDYNCIKLPYDRSASFKDNIKRFENAILKEKAMCLIIGWSIGGVAAGYLSKLPNVSRVAMINPFFKRSDVLKIRNIPCDEEVSLSEVASDSMTRYILISGIKDDKIPYTESVKLQNHFGISNEDFYLFENANHTLESFPVDSLVQIIIND